MSLSRVLWIAMARDESSWSTDSSSSFLIQRASRTIESRQRTSKTPSMTSSGATMALNRSSTGLQPTFILYICHPAHPPYYRSRLLSVVASNLYK
nr:hypothetical protein [uncultured bacterium]